MSSWRSGFGDGGPEDFNEEALLGVNLLDLIQNGDPLAVRECIDRGAKVIPDIGPESMSIMTPYLHVAAGLGRTTVAEILVGAEPECVNLTDMYGRTALHVAALGDHPDTAHVLVQMGVDPDKKDLNGLTAVDLAQARGNTRVLRALEGAGISVEPPKDMAELRAKVAAIYPLSEKAHTTRLRLRKKPEEPDIPIR